MARVSTERVFHYLAFDRLHSTHSSSPTSQFGIRLTILPVLLLCVALPTIDDHHTLCCSRCETPGPLDLNLQRQRTWREAIVYTFSLFSCVDQTPRRGACTYSWGQNDRFLPLMLRAISSVETRLCTSEQASRVPATIHSTHSCSS